MASTTKRAWKLQEFVAHGGSVNCLALGHKSGRVMVTGGDDRKVNMWAVGKPNCVMSLSGHTTPIEAVRFGNAEELVVAGSLSGALKIWDLEAAKIMRTLTGHKSSIRSLDFHPYGDFVASGSLDTNIKLWDIRRKGCIFTYKGHTKCVNSLRFSPDGRWIASAGEDGILKLWDLTAGKMLTDFSHHDGPLTCLEFHPNEFLLATGSLDKTVKFWDLESFQLVSSSDGLCTGIRSICFHPDGLCLYAATQDTVKVYGWEPSYSYDSLTVGWGKVADVAIAQNQLIGATYMQTNVSIYIADIKRMQPVGGPPVQSQPNPSPPKTASGRRNFIVDRPPTQSTKQQKDKPKEEPPEEYPDDGADDQSCADIVDPDNYREVFQPRTRKLAPAVIPVSQPKPASVAPSVPSPVHVTAPADQPVTAAPVIQPATRPSTTRPTTSSTSQKAPTTAKPVIPASTRVSSAASNNVRHNEPTPLIPSDRQQPVNLNMDDFLPKQHQPSISHQPTPANISEQETLSSVIKGGDYMNKVLNSRHKNLQIVRALWTSGNTKTALDSALSMNDLPVIVDLVNVLNQKSGLWSLDLSTIVLPQLGDLLTSKYDNYVETSCSAIKVILRNFGSLIKATLTAPPSIGVDLSREERYNKCKQCYKSLMNIRSILEQKKPAGPQVRELQLLLSQLD
ncbi:hypothetical protein LSH36_61g05001 [Paralvinella palmiformis]|uniref:Katanin p80 WD40 repeat-containing subunit B1 n=1 Tax=Paralvinella palmiformis TaxID=53620 RepID=A0AAD9K453_9ANNE|nr:hypothetical protein LSH36_61g05001 [Paralvinella palmiformis]